MSADRLHGILNTDTSKQREATIMRRAAQTSVPVHPAKSLALELDAQVITTVIAGKARLKSHAWTDQEIMKIESEDLARLAYETSEMLAMEFQSVGSFLSYWRRERSRHGLSSEPTKETMNQAATKSSEQDQTFK
ncbi:MAG: hypothetical protein BVN29_08880 [Nitrospira sp. ST-bin5]|nr:MAG: hypothetical protein BVN29_08880 [Nitrospira sp. ST-bin5]